MQEEKIYFGKVSKRIFSCFCFKGFRTLRRAGSFRFCIDKSSKNDRSCVGGEAPLQIRHFDGFRYAVKMTITAVGQSRPAAALF